ncbi:MAG: peptidylprolyl isomerase [Gemmatimonadota bacterium]|nr:peptidylprolyl isomerase [Gemmatimonadota bacterium]
MRTWTALVTALAMGSWGCGPVADSAEDEPAVSVADTASARTLLLNPRLQGDTAPSTYRARFRTTAGDFVVQVHREWSPRGADRFHYLIRAGYYDSVYVHRVTPGIAQFGFHADPRVNNLWLGRFIGDDPVVVSNTRGRVSFAHAGMNTRSTQIFINLLDNAQYDEQRFTPFSEVVEGMDAVDAFYGGYGEVAPDGNGPVNSLAAFRGNEYLGTDFPELTQIFTITIEGAPALAP